MVSIDDAIAQVSEALSKRTRADQGRRAKLAAAYVHAATARAVAVVTSAELPPTAMKSAQLAMLIAVLDEFEDDVPTPAEIAALFRITPSSANRLLGEVLATSDTATSRLLAGIFTRAKHVRTLNKDGKIANGKVWRFASQVDLRLAKDRLEFRGVEYRTESTADGVYELVVDPDFAADVDPEDAT